MFRKGERVTLVRPDPLHKWWGLEDLQGRTGEVVEVYPMGGHYEYYVMFDNEEYYFVTSRMVDAEAVSPFHQSVQTWIKGALRCLERETV